jgi:hypothetical protein
LAKSWQKGSTNYQTENSETVRRRRGGGRRFVVPRPGATLSHLVKRFCLPVDESVYDSAYDFMIAYKPNMVPIIHLTSIVMEFIDVSAKPNPKLTCWTSLEANRGPIVRRFVRKIAPYQGFKPGSTDSQIYSF